MIGTELAYVKTHLALCTREEIAALAKKIGKQPVTLERIVNGKTRFPRSDITGKLALHFRTQEKRGR